MTNEFIVSIHSLISEELHHMLRKWKLHLSSINQMQRERNLNPHRPEGAKGLTNKALHMNITMLYFVLLWFWLTLLDLLGPRKLYWLEFHTEQLF